MVLCMATSAFFFSVHPGCCESYACCEFCYIPLKSIDFPFFFKAGNSLDWIQMKNFV